MTFTDSMTPIKGDERVYQHLFFDLDRTLWDFETNAVEALSDIYKQFRTKGYIGKFEKFVAVYRNVNEDLWRKYSNGEISKQQLIEDRFYLTFKEFGFDNRALGFEAGKLYLQVSPTKTHLFPGAKDTLDYLSQYYQVHILTNGFKEVQGRKLRNSGLDGYISTLITSEDAGYQKPDVRVFEYALNKVGAKRDESLMIGDDLHADIQGASNAGLKYLWFNPDNRKSTIEESMQISQLAELLQLL